MEQPQPRRLTRSDDRLIGGVAGGLAEYFDIDPTIARVLIALAAILGLPVVIPAYLVLWLVMPPPAGAGARSEAVSRPAADDRSHTLAVLLIGLGAILVLPGVGLPLWFGWHFGPASWPLLLVVAGIVVLLARRDRAVR